jgi:3-deoxy-D-manno-octulosonic-acid transferase
LPAHPVSSPLSKVESIALQLYAVLMQAATPLLRRKLARRAVAEPGYAEAIPERFGVYQQPPETNSELVWVHAVSLGETRTAAILLRAWREACPGLRLLLTHGTATGRAEGASLLQPGDVQVWQPWDSRRAVDLFLTHFKPRMGVLLETEVWPQLMATAQAKHVPVVLLNARLSAKSLAGAERMAWLARPAYRALTAVYAQTEADALRLRQIGAPVAGVFGNLKFDAKPDAAQQALARQWRAQHHQSVLMLASSREGEETEFIRQLVAQGVLGSAVKGLGARLRVLVVPRHPQRFDTVQRLIEQQGLRVSRRSSWSDGPAQSAAAQQADVWLGDTLGEMALYYSLSDLALLGGSFEALGGQNLIEPAACACPVVMGPHTFNFAEAAALAEAEGAAHRTTDMAQGVQQALALLRSQDELQAAAVAAHQVSARHGGAATRTVEALTQRLLPA